MFYTLILAFVDATVSMPSAGAGAAGGGVVGAGLAWYIMHGRVKTLEDRDKEVIQSIATLPGLVSKITDLVTRIEQVENRRYHDDLEARARDRDIRRIGRSHQRRITRLEYRHNEMVRVLKSREPGSPISEIPDDLTPIMNPDDSKHGE